MSLDGLITPPTYRPDGRLDALNKGVNQESMDAFMLDLKAKAEAKKRAEANKRASQPKAPAKMAPAAPAAPTAMGRRSVLAPGPSTSAAPSTPRPAAYSASGASGPRASTGARTGPVQGGMGGTGTRMGGGNRKSLLGL